MKDHDASNSTSPAICARPTNQTKKICVPFEGRVQKKLGFWDKFNFLSLCHETWFDTQWFALQVWACHGFLGRAWRPYGVTSASSWRTPPTTTTPPTGWPPPTTTTLPLHSHMITWWMVVALGLHADEAYLFVDWFSYASGLSVPCEAPNVHCDNDTKCLTPSQLCDDVYDCQDQSDEGLLCGEAAALVLLHTGHTQRNARNGAFWRKSKAQKWCVKIRPHCGPGLTAVKRLKLKAQAQRTWKSLGKHLNLDTLVLFQS